MAGATPVETVTATAEFTGAVSWSSNGVPLAGNFSSGAFYVATITITPTAGYTLTGVDQNFFTLVGATNINNAADSGVVTAYFTPALSPANDYLDSTFGNAGTINLMDIFGEEPINENGAAVGPVKVDGIEIDSQDRLIVLGSFYGGNNRDRSVPGALGNVIGTGYQNSINIAMQEGNSLNYSAAVAARAYRSTVSEVEIGDWYLPSIEELWMLSATTVDVGPMPYRYWSSTEDGQDASQAMYIDFDAELESSDDKSSNWAVRPIRSGTLSNTALGEIGPGGGKIFYVSNTPFNCGPTLSATCNYLEAAPINWDGGEDPQISWSAGSVDNHILFRLNPDGSYDNSFGNPGSTLRKNLSDSPKQYVAVTETCMGYRERLKLHIDSQDKILVLLSGSTDGLGCLGYHNFVARYLSNGIIDTEFGTDGVIGSLLPQTDFPQALFADFTIDAQDNILVASLSNQNYDPVMVPLSEVLIQRFDEDGRVAEFSISVEINYPEDSAQTPMRDLHIIADENGGYIVAFTGLALPINGGDFPFTQLIRLLGNGMVDSNFNVQLDPEFESPDNIIPNAYLTDLVADGPRGFILSANFAFSIFENQSFAITVRYLLNGDLDLGFLPENGDAEDSLLAAQYCYNSAILISKNLDPLSDLIFLGEICGVLNGWEESRIKAFSSSGVSRGGLSRGALSIESPVLSTITEMKVTSDGKLLVLSGAKPQTGLLGFFAGGFYSSSSWVNPIISRYLLGEPSTPPVVTPPVVTPPVVTPPVVVYVPPAPVPFLKTLSAPKMHLKDEKLICSAGTYNAGYQVSGVNQGSSTSLFTSSAFTFRIFLDGVSQESFTVTSESATASWKMPVAPSGALMTCSVTVSANGVTNSDKSTDNNDGIASAMDLQVSARNRAEINYSESLTASDEAYEKVLSDNRLTWQTNIEKQRRDYQTRLAKIKSLPSTKATRASATRALNHFSSTRAKILANYTTRNKSALAAKELADRQALVSRDAAIAKATATYRAFIESIGHGVLIP